MEYPSAIRWRKENVNQIMVKFYRKTDLDVYDYIKDRNKRDMILLALRYMKAHEEEVKKWGEENCLKLF